MAKIVYVMMQSLDGYIAGPEGGPGLPMPDDALHRHFNEHVWQISGSLYGRRMYEVMRYWDVDQPDQNDIGVDFAAAWRASPKWVVSNSLQSVGPNATLVKGDLSGFVTRLKADHDGEIEVSGPALAGQLTDRKSVV